jgi:hypothetical protein
MACEGLNRFELRVRRKTAFSSRFWRNVCEFEQRHSLNINMPVPAYLNDSEGRRRYNWVIFEEIQAVTEDFSFLFFFFITADVSTLQQQCISIGHMFLSLFNIASLRICIAISLESMLTS